MNVINLWAAGAVLIALAAALSLLGGWHPREAVALVATLAVAGAAALWARAWHAVRAHEAEATTLSPDEQAAWLLGESLARCGASLDAGAIKEVWDVFAAVPDGAKRSLALAVTGFLAGTDRDSPTGLGDRLLALVRGFRDPLASADDGQIARAFGRAVGRCGAFFDGVGTKELWGVFAALPGDAKRGLTNALIGFLSSADLTSDDAADEKVLALARSFRERAVSVPGSRPTASVPHTLPVRVS